MVTSVCISLFSIACIINDIDENFSFKKSKDNEIFLLQGMISLSRSDFIKILLDLQDFLSLSEKENIVVPYNRSFLRVRKQAIGCSKRKIDFIF